ncbi:sensor histidine kinase [Aequorivita soesokkakensis]|nr:ATP-binding protein [Aequorivita soesokkakensis]
MAQLQEKELLPRIQSCKTKECKLINAFKLAEHYLETDEIPLAQKWLDSCKIWSFENPEILNQSDIFSLQSELFYYFGLFQFGTTEAEKGIDFAMKEKDSASIADLYFFKGINLFEMRNYVASGKALKNAEKFYSSEIKTEHLRTFIKPEHIYNNLGQLKLQLKDWDSAYYYNEKAYRIAKIEKSGRALANCEQTFGLIKLGKQQKDSAVFYFHKSKQTALAFNYYDIATVNEGFLMKAFIPQKDSVLNHFRNGEILIENYPVNTLFKRYFFKEAASIFEVLEMEKQTIALQKKILQIEDSIRFQGNSLVQNISQQYLENEKELFNLQRNEFEKQKKVSLLQITTLLLITFLLIVMVLLFRRKNKVQKRLLQQKTEISNDLHDDIGSNLTSILIHAQMLEAQENLSVEQKKTASKISSTGAEIGQRLNTFIWTLNEAHDNLQDFLEYVKHYAAKTLEGMPIKLEYLENIKNASEIKISGQMRKNIFYCIKELIANALKHSESTNLSIKISLTEKRFLQILIQDNGKGFQKGKRLGNGLLNIEKRMQAHKGTFTYTSEKGFSATLLLPL